MTAIRGRTGAAGAPAVSGADDAAAAPRQQRMRAIVRDEYGSADVLRFGEIDRPTIGADEVLVRVRAAGLDRAPGTSWPACRTCSA